MINVDAAVRSENGHAPARRPDAATVDRYRQTAASWQALLGGRVHLSYDRGNMLAGDVTSRGHVLSAWLIVEPEEEIAIDVRGNIPEQLADALYQLAAGHLELAAKCRTLAEGTVTHA